MPTVSYAATIALIHFLAALSPGPNFILITRNSLLHSRKAGFFTVAGVMSGGLIHIALAIFGISLLIYKSPTLHPILQYGGAAYLFYLGLQSLFKNKTSTQQHLIKRPKQISILQAYQMGITTTLLNPKSIIYFITIFAVVIDMATPTITKWLYGLIMIVVGFFVYSTEAYLFSHAWFKDRIQNFQNVLDKIFGLLLLAVSLKIVFN